MAKEKKSLWRFVSLQNTYWLLRIALLLIPVFATWGIIKMIPMLFNKATDKVVDVQNAVNVVTEEQRELNDTIKTQGDKISRILERVESPPSPTRQQRIPAPVKREPIKIESSASEAKEQDIFLQSSDELYAGDNNRKSIKAERDESFIVIEDEDDDTLYPGTTRRHTIRPDAEE